MTKKGIQELGSKDKSYNTKKKHNTEVFPFYFCKLKHPSIRESLNKLKITENKKCINNCTLIELLDRFLILFVQSSIKELFFFVSIVTSFSVLNVF